jgi:hypothetical protein
MGTLLGTPYTSRQATYDLRRLRRKGLIQRIPRQHRYRVTPQGRAVACFLTKLHAHVVVPVLTDLDDICRPSPTTPRPIVSAWRQYERELDALIATLDAA